MENIIGDWKLVAMLTYNDEFEKIWGDRAYFEAHSDEDDEPLKMFDIVTRFTDGGKCLQLMALPEGITPKIVAEEGLEMIGDQIVIESHDWKEENGKLWLDSGESREALGETLSSFDEIKFEGEIMVLPMLKLQRI